jgi:hypothetical protein
MNEKQSGRAILSHLIAGFPPTVARFDQTFNHAECVLNMALEWVSSQDIGYPCQYSFHKLLRVINYLMYYMSIALMCIAPLSEQLKNT